MNKYCFRPQQGLTIMNAYGFDVAMLEVEFPSPTGATYYEFYAHVTFNVYP